MTLEELITDLNHNGYWVNNLCQHADASWQANVVKHTPEGLCSWEFAYGATPIEALSFAWDKAKTTEANLHKPKARQNYGLPKANLSVEDLLKDL